MADPAKELIRLAMERFGNLLPGEAKMLRAAAEGTVADVADQEGDEKLTRESAWGCWEKWGEHRKIRAEVLRWVLVDEAAAGLVHEHGVIFENARIDGAVDLFGARLHRRIGWKQCAIEDGLALAHAWLPGLCLTGSHTGAFFGQQLRTDGSIHLDAGMVVRGEVRLFGAKIGGHLACIGSTFENPPGVEGSSGRALHADGMDVTGNVFVRESTNKGEVRLLGAKIGGDLDCVGSTFENPPGFKESNGKALSADRIEVKGEVFLSDRMTARGEVRLPGAMIGGSLDCSGSTFENPPGVEGSSGKALNADGMDVAGGVLLREGMTARGEVRLPGAKIGGSLDCSGSTFENRPGVEESSGDALVADGIDVAGGVLLHNGMTAKGGVRLPGAKIGGDLSCTGSTFENPPGVEGSSGIALAAYWMNVTGSVLLREGMTTKGEVRLPGAKIGGDLSCSGSTIENPPGVEGSSGIALNAFGMDVAGNVCLCEGLTTKGEVRLLGAKIGGDLDCGGSTFENPPGPKKSTGKALSADRIDVAGSVFLCAGMAARGEVRLLGAKISGSLDCAGSTFENPPGVEGSSGDALIADGIDVVGGVVLREGMTANGEVRLVGAKIGGNLECNRSTFWNPPGVEGSSGRALSADGIDVSGGVFLSGGMTAKGEVRLPSAKIGRNLECEGATFENPPRVGGGGGIALAAYGMDVTGNVFLRHGEQGQRARVHGTLLIVGGKIGGDLQLIGLDCNGDINLDRTTVGQTLHLNGNTRVKGAFDLSDARVARIHDAKGAWAECARLNLNGFRYGSFTDECTMSVQDRIAWIERGMKDASGTYVYSPLPYRQLAGVYAAMGQAENCVIVRQEQYRKLREHERPTGVWPPTKLQGWLRWFWRVVIDKAIGCGYAPLRPMWFMLGLWVLGCVVFNEANKAKLFAPASDQVLTSGPYVESRTLPPDYQPLNAWLYSADTMLPIIDFHQERFWLPGWGRECSVLGFDNPYAGRILRYYLWFHIAAGWILSTLFVVGLSGIVKNEDGKSQEE